MPECKLDYLFSFSFALKLPPEVIGELPDGIRANFYLDGGTVEGPRLTGKVLPVGADYLVIRKDGVGLLDVRATFECADGALIYAPYRGTIDAGPDGYDRFLANDLPTKMPVRSAPRFQTAHADYVWLNRLQCFGVGECDLGANRVSYDVYAAP
jgi:hypothetical protein